MKVLMCGAREWTRSEPIKRELDTLPKDTIVIHGACKGADSLCGYFARKKGFEVKEYPAEWKDNEGNYRPWAGPERNQLMLDLHPDIDLVIAFHSNIAESKGTADMLRRATKAQIEVKVVTD